MVKFNRVTALDLLGKARSSALTITGLIVFLFIFLWRLSSSTTGASSSEVHYRGAAKLSAIVSNPLFLPYKVLENILFHLSHGRLMALRFGSVIMALIFVYLFFYVLKKWFGTAIALLSVLLMTTTPLFMLYGRSAVADILYAAPIVVLFSYEILLKKSSNKYKLLACVGLISLSFYIPGMIWLLIISFVFWRTNLKTLLADNSRGAITVAVSLALLLLIPLLYAFVIHPSIIKSWLLLPQHLGGIKSIIKNIINAILAIFISNHAPNTVSSGNLPLLNAAQIGLLIFGIHAMQSKLRKTLYWLGSLLIVIVCLAGLNNNFSILLLALPVATFICGMGLRFLFIEWRSVFPKNPLAKAFALSLMTALVAMHVLYGLRYSLLAWPATPAVKQEYMLK